MTIHQQEDVQVQLYRCRRRAMRQSLYVLLLIGVVISLIVFRTTFNDPVAVLTINLASLAMGFQASATATRMREARSVQPAR